MVGKSDCGVVAHDVTVGAMKIVRPFIHFLRPWFYLFCPHALFLKIEDTVGRKHPLRFFHRKCAGMFNDNEIGFIITVGEMFSVEAINRNGAA